MYHSDINQPPPASELAYWPSTGPGEMQNGYGNLETALVSVPTLYGAQNQPNSGSGPEMLSGVDRFPEPHMFRMASGSDSVQQLSAFPSNYGTLVPRGDALPHVPNETSFEARYPSEILHGAPSSSTASSSSSSYPDSMAYVSHPQWASSEPIYDTSGQPNHLDMTHASHPLIQQTPLMTPQHRMPHTPLPSHTPNNYIPTQTEGYGSEGSMTFPSNPSNPSNTEIIPSSQPPAPFISPNGGYLGAFPPNPPSHMFQNPTNSHYNEYPSQTSHFPSDYASIAPVPNSPPISTARRLSEPRLHNQQAMAHNSNPHAYQQHQHSAAVPSMSSHPSVSHTAAPLPSLTQIPPFPQNNYPAGMSSKAENRQIQPSYAAVNDFDYYGTSSPASSETRVNTQLYSLAQIRDLPTKAPSGKMSKSSPDLPALPMQRHPATSKKSAPNKAQTPSPAAGPTQFQFHHSAYMTLVPQTSSPSTTTTSASSTASMSPGAHMSPKESYAATNMPTQHSPTPLRHSQVSIKPDPSQSAPGEDPSYHYASVILANDDLDIGSLLPAKKAKYAESSNDDFSLSSPLSFTVPISSPQVPQFDAADDTSSDTASLWTPIKD